MHRREATGFDGGSSHLAAVRLARSGEKYRVKSFGYINTLNPLDDPNFELTFRKFKREEGIRTKNLTVGLSGRSVMVRYIKVPIVPDWKLDMMMEFEIDEQTSKFAKDSYCDYRKVDIPGIRKHNVMMIGVGSRDYIEYYLDTVSGVDVFNLNSLALYNASLISDQIGGEETVMIADIGAFNTEVAIVRGNLLLFARNIQYGANHFDEDIITVMNVDISQAERLKIEKGQVWHTATPSDGSLKEEKKLNESLTSSARMLYTHLSSAVQYCKEQVRFFDFKIDKILTTGGGSRLNGLNEFLAERFDAPVENLNILDRLDLDALSQPQTEKFQENIHHMTTAIGLALTHIVENGALLNPMPKRVLARRRFLHREFHLITAAALFLISLIFWGWMIVAGNAGILDEIDYKKNLLEDAEKLSAEVRAEEVLYNRYLAMENALEERVYSSTDMLTIFNVLQQTLPDNIWITSFSTEDIGTITTTETEEGSPESAGDEESTLQQRGTIYISGQVKVDPKSKVDPHQLLDDYTSRLKSDYVQFNAFIPMVKEYSDNTVKDKFFYKYKILISNKNSNVLEK